MLSIKYSEIYEIRSSVQVFVLIVSLQFSQWSSKKYHSHLCAAHSPYSKDGFRKHNFGTGGYMTSKEE